MTEPRVDSKRPVMAALDLFGRRWTMRIIWELRFEPLGFRRLQAQCDDMSSSVLQRRLSELVDARIIEQLEDTSYALTSVGEAAFDAFKPLLAWSEEWARGLESNPTTNG